VGLPHERLAVRIVLTFNMISEIQYEYDLLKRSNNSADSKSEAPHPIGSGFLQRLDRLAVLGATLFTNVVEKAQQQGGQSVALPEESAPPVVQWAWPIFLAAGFLSVKLI
jgi:hypothetical protein